MPKKKASEKMQRLQKEKRGERGAGKRGNSVRLSRNHFDVFAYFHAVFQFAKFRCRRRSVHSGAKSYKGFKIFI